MLKHQKLLRVVALLLVVSLTIPVCVNAETVQPRASDYLDSYNTYICPMGGGDLQIWYTVVADVVMDHVGVLSIILYESVNQSTWTRVKTYSHEKYPTMLLEDDFVHSSYVSYDAIPGRYYKAYVCIWAGRNGGGDTRYMWTSVKRAT